MYDLVIASILLACFAATWGLVLACQRLREEA